MEHIRRGRRAALRVAGATALLGVTGWVVGGTATSAFADSTGYELYCPGTPVGTIALNDVITTATITPAAPAAGSTFQVTNWQTKVTLPSSIVGAAAALGNAAIQGSATAKLDATGATPASLTAPAINFNQPIPSPVPTSGMLLTLPTAAGQVGPFTASGGPISISEDSSASLTLVVSGNNLTLTCTAYQNNAVPTGITTAKPSGSPLSPQIATASAGSGGGGGTTATTAPATTATTAAPAPATAPANSGSLAYTGAGPGVLLLGELGIGGLAAAALLMLGYRARTTLVSVHRGRRHGSGD